MNWYKKFSYFIDKAQAYFIDGDNEITRVDNFHIYDIMERFELRNDIKSKFEEMFNERIDWDKDWDTVTEFVKDYMLEHHIFNIVVDVKNKQVYVRPNLGEGPSDFQLKAISDWAIEHGWNENVIIDIVTASNSEWYKKSAKEYEKLKDGEYYVSDFMKPKENPDISDFKTESKWTPVDSSFIKAVAYYKPLKMFEIRLNDGREYSYTGVPSVVYKNFMKSKSKGEYFNRVIKKRYPFE